jgi:hypothetical protein
VTTEGTAAALDPRPVGWFAVGLSRDLRPGGALDGVLAAAPFRLTRAKGGALSFEGSIGAVVEQNGFLLAWHHPSGHAPSWHVPALDETGWRPLRYHHLTARSHPQETYENSIDTAHFPVIHGYTGIEIVQPMQCEGHGLKVGYRIARALPIPLVDWKLAPTFEVRLHGIGCAHNHIHVAELGLRVRMFALSTPTEPGRVDIRLGVSIARDNRIPLKQLSLPIAHRAVMRGIVHDFEQDMAIWENKRYLDRPVLVRDDGPIGKFRQWCRQFYVDGADSLASASA